jgi:hypothetical protein
MIHAFYYTRLIRLITVAYVYEVTQYSKIMWFEINCVCRPTKYMTSEITL